MADTPVEQRGLLRLLRDNLRARLIRGIQTQPLPEQRVWHEPLYYGQDRGEPPAWSKDSALQAYTSHVYAAVSLRAEAVSSLWSEMQLVRVEDDGTEVPIQHEVLKLLERPNDFYTGVDLAKKTVQHLDLTGDAFWWMVPNSIGGSAQVWPLFPHLTRIVLDAEKFIAGAVYFPDGLSRKGFPIPWEQIVHFKYQAPDDHLYGWSPLRAAAYAKNIRDYAQIYEEAWFKNQARPDYWVMANVPPGPDAQDQLERLYARVIMHHQGADNWGAPGFLPGGSDVKAIQYSMKDMQFLELTRAKRDEIFEAFRTPPILHGHMETYGKEAMETAKVYFAEHAVQPILSVLAAGIDCHMVHPLLRGDARAKIKFPNPVPESIEVKLATWKQHAELRKVTDNEYREEFGLEPIEGGDEIQRPQLMLPPEPDDTDDDSSSEMEAPGGESRAVKPLHLLRSPSSATRPGASFPGLDTPEKRAAYWKASIQVPTRFEQIMLRAVNVAFRRQAKVVEAAMQPGVERLAQRFAGVGARKTARTLGEWIRKDELDEFGAWPIEELERVFNDALSGVIRRVYDAGGEFGSNMIGFDWNIGNPHAVAFLEGHTTQLAGQVTRETRRQVARALANGVSEGEGIRDLMRRITGTFEEFESQTITRGRAARIARTETTTAYSRGKIDSWRDPAVAGLVVAQQWITARDATVRDSHAALDGEIVKEGSTFSNGLTHPGDPNGAPEEIINCRCDIAPILASEAARSPFIQQRLEDAA